MIDTKGCPDNVANLKRKLFWYVFPSIDYKWITYVKKFGGWIEYEECKRRRREEKKKLTEKKESDGIKGDKHGKDNY